jgi:SAM-dependent methyltransferase
MKECSKSIPRRLGESNFLTKYFVGNGIDIGGYPDPLALYTELFPKISSVRTWDLQDGDAQYMEGVADGFYDFVHSSHCLEHMKEPNIAIFNWFRILKPEGHLIITVPDEDLYEQGQFPSSFNKDHKWTFTIFKKRSWSKKSINVIELLTNLGGQADVKKVEILDQSYRYNLPRYDQTLTPIGECGIEIVVRKRSLAEVQEGGRLRRAGQVPKDLKIHLNQYRDDLQTLKSQNTNNPPFFNDRDL